MSKTLKELTSVVASVTDAMKKLAPSLSVVKNIAEKTRQITGNGAMLKEALARNKSKLKGRMKLNHGPSISAPARVETVLRSRPAVSYDFGRNVSHVNDEELLVTLPPSATGYAAGSIIYSVKIDCLMTRRLRKASETKEHYQFDTLKFDYNVGNATSANGAIAMFYVSDPEVDLSQQSGDTLYSMASSFDGFKTTSIFRPISSSPPRAGARGEKAYWAKKYVNKCTAQYTPRDADECTCGRLYVMCMQAIGANVPIGTLSVNYNITFSGSGYQLTNIEGSAAGIHGGGSLTTALIFGDAPKLFNFTNLGFKFSNSLGYAQITLPPGHWMVVTTIGGTGISSAEWTVTSGTQVSQPFTISGDQKGATSFLGVYNNTGSVVLSENFTAASVTSSYAWIAAMPFGFESLTDGGSALSSCEFAALQLKERDREAKIAESKNNVSHDDLVVVEKYCDYPPSGSTSSTSSGLAPVTLSRQIQQPAKRS